MSFILKSKEDCAKILQGDWTQGVLGLCIKNWFPSFDLQSKKLHMKEIWAMLLGFPWELWREYILKEGNQLGHLCGFRGCMGGEGGKKDACILVKLYLKKWLLVELGIDWGP